MHTLYHYTDIVVYWRYVLNSRAVPQCTFRSVRHLPLFKIASALFQKLIGCRLRSKQKDEHLCMYMKLSSICSPGWIMRGKTITKQRLLCTMTNKCTIISQIITLLHVSTLSCHPQGACNQYVAKLHKYFKCNCIVFPTASFEILV